MAILLDTGILLRLWDRKDPAHILVVSSVRLLYRQGIELVTSAQNIAGFWNVSTRPSSARGGYGRSVDEADRRVQFFERYGRVLSDTPTTYLEWRRLVKEHRIIGVAVHDARIAAQMIAWGLDEILTLNPDDFRRYTEITVRTPSEIISSGSV